MPQVSLDGGNSWQEVDEVSVVYEELEIPGEDGDGEILFKFTHEGLVTDVWSSREEEYDHNIATSSETIDEIVERMVEN